MHFFFPKVQRVLRSGDFTRVLRKGTCVADGTLVLYALPAEELATRPNTDASRLGVTIPKKTGNAVVRNRWKRLIRESFRTQLDQVPTGFDFIVRPKKGAEPVWAEIQKSIPRLTQKAARQARRK